VSTDLRPQLDATLGGRYAIKREVGRGGMATVYLARDAKHERRVALKVLDPELGAVLGALDYAHAHAVIHRTEQTGHARVPAAVPRARRAPPGVERRRCRARVGA
jgi:hypothetical protein